MTFSSILLKARSIPRTVVCNLPCSRVSFPKVKLSTSWGKQVDPGTVSLPGMGKANAVQDVPPERTVATAGRRVLATVVTNNPTSRSAARAAWDESAGYRSRNRRPGL